MFSSLYINGKYIGEVKCWYVSDKSIFVEVYELVDGRILEINVLDYKYRDIPDFGHCFEFYN